MSTEEMGKLLENDNESIAKRSRLLWHVRKLPIESAIEILTHGLKSKSCLQRHEVCYVLGQMRSPSAIPLLESLVANLDEHPMVRHESGEALGAIGEASSIPFLEKYVNDPVVEVAETCQLAIENIKDRIANKDVHNEDDDQFDSLDPALAAPAHKTTAELRKEYLDMGNSLYARYKAMFALRNKVSKYNDLEALTALCDAFKLKGDSALFKHEIGYVLGQLQRIESAPALEAVLRDVDENPIVRHEAAEALGSICDPKSLAALAEFENDPAEPVRESCTVALDMHAYWSKWNAKQD